MVKTMLVVAALALSGCMMNPTDYLHHQVDDLLTRTQRSEQAHAGEQQNIQNLANMVGDLQRRLPAVEAQLKPKEEKPKAEKK